MAESAFRTAALVLVGHGSARNPHSSQATRQHAETIRRRGLFAEVHVAFWKETPLFADVLDAVQAPDIFIVPNLACRGYITGQIIPREMGLDGPLTVQGDTRIRLCDPVGTHPRIAEVVAERVQAVITAHGLRAEDTCVALIGHGTTRNPESAIRTNAVANQLQAMGLGTQVRTAFLEQEPRVETWEALTQAANIVVMPFMISNGLHGAEDIPALLGLDPADSGFRKMAETGIPTGPYTIRGRRLWYCRAVGAEPVVADIIVDLVQDAVDRE